MTNTHLLTFASLVAVSLAACNSKDTLLSVNDGAVDHVAGTGGAAGTGTGGASGRGGSSGGSGGTITVGSGGAGTGGISGTGGSSGVGGISGVGGAGKGGNGGASLGGSGGGAGTSGTGGLGAGGTGVGGTGTRDGGSTDTAKDVATSGDGNDAADGIVECAPGYAIGSTRPAGDGCNICTCKAGGYFACTTAQCSDAAAAVEAGQCPAGQMWCPGCTAGTGSCGVVCTGAPCLIDAAVGADTSTGTCSQLTTQADCQARGDCHAVFTDPGTCGCAALGCCARFSQCTDGGKAVCTATPACTIPTPHCEGPYVISYTTMCYEGCVLSTECGS